MDFGQWINHATERNYVDCSTLRGEPNLLPKAKTDQLKGKAAISRALRESFDYCDAAFAALDDQKIPASPQMTYAFLHTTVHNNEIYGNIVGYLRANRITPPSTEMIQEMIKAKKTPEQMFKEMMDRYNKKPLAGSGRQRIRYSASSCVRTSWSRPFSFRRSQSRSMTRAST